MDTPCPFRRSHDPVNMYPDRVRGWTVNCTVPLRETRSTAAPSMRPSAEGRAGSSPAGGTIFINPKKENNQ